MAKAIASDATPGTAAELATPPARDPRLAVEDEYQLARRLNTVQSLELFVARHPDEPLAARARTDRRLLSRYIERGEIGLGRATHHLVPCPRTQRSTNAASRAHLACIGGCSRFCA